MTVGNENIGAANEQLPTGGEMEFEIIEEPQADTISKAEVFDVGGDQFEVIEEAPDRSFSKTTLLPEEEEEFQNFMATNPAVVKWKSKFQDTYGDLPNTDTDSDYDYRGAWKAGIVPVDVADDSVPHWASIGIDGKELKSKNHPTRWMSDYYEATGVDPNKNKITKDSAIKALKNEGYDVSHLSTSSMLDSQEFKVPLNKLRETDPSQFNDKVNEILEQENKFNSIPKMDNKDKSTYFGDFMERVGAGGLGFVRSTFRVPSLIQDIKNLPREAIADYFLNKKVKSGELTDEQAKEARDLYDQTQIDKPFKDFLDENVAENQVTRFLDDNANKLRESSQRYDKSIEAYLKTGEYTKALGAAGLGAGESLVPTITAAFTGGAGLVTLGLTSAAEKKAELDNVSDVAESVKTANALLTGSFEAITEKVGTHQIGGFVKSIYKDFGKEAAEKAIKEGFIANMKTYYKKLGIYTAPVQEGLSEAANQFLENVTDIVTGTSPDLNPFSGVVDAFSIGTITGTGFQAAAVPGQIAGQIKERKAKNHEDMLDEIMQKREGVTLEGVEAGQVEAADKVELAPEPQPELEEIQKKTDELKEAGVDVSNLSVEEIESQHEQLQKPKEKIEPKETVEDAEKQQSEQVREETQQEKVEEVSDKDLPKVNETKLQDREKTKEKVEAPKKEVKQPEITEEQIEEVKTPEAKDKVITSEINKTAQFKKLPPERRSEEESRRDNNIVAAKVIEKLGKAFPKVEVISDKAAYDAKAAELNETSPSFVEDGVVYLDPTRTSTEGAVEEFAHVFIRVGRDVNETAIQKGFELVQDSKYFEDVQNGPRYADITPQQREAKTDEMLEEALAKAIADKGAQLLNKSAFKQVAESIGKPISKTLRKLGFSPKVDLFGETLEGFTTKASKDILSELPITKFTSEDLVKIKDRTDGKRYEGEDVKVAGSILDLKSKGSALATRAKLFAKTDRGAGKKLELENRQREQRVAKHVKEAEFIVMDFNDALSNYIKDTKGVNEQETLDLIQEALTTDTSFGEGNANQSRFDALNLPEELITQIKRMRNKVDALTMSLQNDGVLVNEDIRAILNKNLGFYLNRTYQKHLVDNWAEKYKKLIPKEDFDRIQNYFRNQYETSNIASVNWSKTKDGGYIVSFKNTAGVRSDKVGKGVDSGKIKLESLDEVTDKFGQIGFSPADIIGLREAMEDTFDDDGNLKKTANSYTLQDETGEQDVIKFGMTSEQMDNLISSVVGNDKIVEDITLGRGIQTGIGASAGLGSVETGPLKKRKDIAEPVRILLGEIVDPRANFTNTVYKMANLLEKGKFENMLIREGERTFLTPNRTATNTVQLTEEDSRIFGNLQIGEETEAREYWTSPEIYDLLYGKVKPNSNPVIQSLIMMNGLAKAALTIGKPDSQARNYWGAVWNLASTGRMPQYLTTSAKVSFADATKTQRALSIMSSPLAVTLGVSTAINKKSVDEIREIHLEAAERGLLGENPQAGIVEDLVKYVDGSKTSFSTLEKIKDFQRRHFDNFSKPYQATDEVFKVSQWQQEIDDYTKFYPNKSKEEIMDITAEIVRKTQPTYSNSSKAEKLLSKTPLAGSFIMFSAQQYRTKVAIMQQAAKEIREGKQQNIPGMAALGRKRLAALAGISLITPTLAIMTRLAMGWSADEDEAISAGMPFYGQNNYRIYLNGDKKKPLFLDMTFVDPFSQFQKPFVAAWRGEDISDKIGGFISETADPFASPEIYTQRVLELFHNEDQYGKAIAKEEYGAIINTGRVLSHALDPFVPGYAKTFANIYKGAVDYSEDYGKEYSLANELTNVGLGVKVKERDTQKMYRSKISLARGIMNAARSNYAIKSKADRDTRLDIISQEKQYKLAVSKSKEKFDEIKKSMDHMIALGYNKAEISATLKEAKVPKYMIKQLFRGEFLGIFKQDIKVGGKVKAKKGDFVKYETLKYYKK